MLWEEAKEKWSQNYKKMLRKEATENNKVKTKEMFRERKKREN